MARALLTICLVLLVLAPRPAAGLPAAPTIERGPTVHIERALLGLSVGHRKQVVVKPEDAFG